MAKHFEEKTSRLDKKIYDAFDKIQPDDAALDRMLCGILEKQEKSTKKAKIIPFKFATAIAAGLIIALAVPLIWSATQKVDLETLDNKPVNQTYVSTASQQSGENPNSQRGSDNKETTSQLGEKETSSDEVSGNSSSGMPGASTPPVPAYGEEGTASSGANTPSGSTPTPGPGTTNKPASNTPKPTVAPQKTAEPTAAPKPKQAPEDTGISFLTQVDISTISDSDINSANQINPSGSDNSANGTNVSNCDIFTAAVLEVKTVRYSGDGKLYTLAVLLVDKVINGNVSSGSTVHLVMDCISDTRKSLSSTSISGKKPGAAMRAGINGVFILDEWSKEQGSGCYYSNGVSGMFLDTAAGLVYSGSSYKGFRGTNYEDAIAYAENDLLKQQLAS